MIKYVLFPFNKVLKDSRIVVYGAGDIGKNFKNQIDATQYCKIVCFIDKMAKKIKSIDGIKCDVLDNINSYEFDYLIIASIAYREEIYNNILTNEEVKKKRGGGNLLNKNKVVLLDEKNSIYISYSVRNTPEGDWENYYKSAELSADSQFNKYLLPLIKKYINLNKESSVVLDFACGHGRIAYKVKNLCKKIICCDISENAINFCKQRFKDFDNVDYAVNGFNKIYLNSKCCDLIYSWDAMVHFSYKLLDIYADEFYRILKPNGYAIIHHSNLADSEYVQSKSDIWCDNIGCRSNVSAEDYAYIAEKHGFKVIEQNVIDWSAKDLDCITVLKKE